MSHVGNSQASGTRKRMKNSGSGRESKRLKVNNTDVANSENVVEDNNHTKTNTEIDCENISLSVLPEPLRTDGASCKPSISTDDDIFSQIVRAKNGIKSTIEIQVSSLLYS